jgi:hypothetical protein
MGEKAADRDNQENNDDEGGQLEQPPDQSSEHRSLLFLSSIQTSKAPV